MQARTSSRCAPDTPSATPASTDGIRACIASLVLDAAAFVSPVRVQETARGWLARTDAGTGNFGTAEPGRDMLLVAEALGMAADLALFTPSAQDKTCPVYTC